MLIFKESYSFLITWHSQADMGNELEEPELAVVMPIYNEAGAVSLVIDKWKNELNRLINAGRYFLVSF